MECPHLGQAVKINDQFLDKLRSETIKSWNCSVCRSSKSPWICLRCGVVNCGRYVNGHAKGHHESSHHHCVCLDTSLAVFCYTCDEFVVNDTKTTDIQRLREILLDAQAERPPKKRNLPSEGTDYPRKSLRLSENMNRTTHNKYIPGLRNLGNTCFMNAILQSLSNIQQFCCYFKELPAIEQENATNSFGKRPYFTRSYKADDALLVEELRKVLCALWLGHSAAIAPDALFSVVWKVVPRFRGFQQQDAHEFMHYLLDRVHTELLQSKKAFHGKETIVTGIFGGILHSEVNCLECSTESKKLDPFLDLSLDIPLEFQTRKAKSKDHKVCQLTDCLQSFTDLETLQESEFYICPKCKVRRPSTKKFWLSRLPNVLILHLKRFKFISFLRSKIDTYVRCPLRGLDMRKYLLPSQQEKYSKEACVYDLAAVVVHHGSGVSAGHYTAYTWHEGHWYNFNDSCVTQTTEDVVARCKGYIYFYTRRQVDMSIIEKLKSIG